MKMTPQAPQDTELFQLLDYLEEEFREVSGARVRLRQPATTTRSPDLPQDYDPESNELHRLRGVLVRIDSREYYFPAEWAGGRHRGEIDAQVRSIKESLNR